MMKLIVFLVFLLVALDGRTEASCSIKLYRSPDRSTMMIQMPDDKLIYLTLEDSPRFPAIQFLVHGNDSVTVYDKQAATRVTNIDSLQSQRDNESRQFQFLTSQFSQQESAIELEGMRIRKYESFDENGFHFKWTGKREYKVGLVDVPVLRISYKSFRTAPHYEITSPLFDLETQINANCWVRAYRHGVPMDPARLTPMYRPLKSDKGWNPMDTNSWTVFDRQNQQPGPQPTGGFRFARPLSLSEPSEPESSSEPDSPL